MHRPALLLAATALIASTACSDSKTETRTTNDSDARSTVTLDADTDSGKLELKLPGGFEAKVDLPKDMDSLDGENAKFDIDGVGLFPGAKVRSINVNASDRKDTRSAVVRIGFNAPADAAAVADWYQQQFEAKSIKVTRSGEALSGTSEDGDQFTIALEAAGTGASKGVVTITDSKAG